MEFLERVKNRAAARRLGSYLGERAGKGLCFAQDDLSVANAPGATVRADINSNLQALGNLMDGTTAPATTYKNLLWADRTTNTLKRRNAANTGWIVTRTLDESFVLSRSANTLLGLSDIGKTIRATGTWSQTFDAVTTLADGWWVRYINEGTGVITLDPNASETIDGQTTIALNPGESCLIVCNATNLKTVALIRFAFQFGQCRLTKSGANLLLSRFNGASLFINGRWENIPSAGVTLAATGATANTTYYVYAFMSSGTMTLEFSATAPATDPNYGHQIKTADGTRTLVGIARAITGPAWADTATQRFVLSYFNRRAIGASNSFTTNRAITTGVLSELHSEIRTEFLTWGDESVAASFMGSYFGNVARVQCNAAIGIDGTTPENDGYQHLFTASNANDQQACAVAMERALTEGYHYATMLASSDNTNTSTWIGAAAASPRSSMHVRVEG